MEKEDALKLFAAERKRQIKKGYTAEHDDNHKDGGILDVAVAVARNASKEIWNDWAVMEAARITDKHANDKIRLLVIAGSMIAAEIERLLRCEAKAKKKPKSRKKVKA